MVRSNRDIVQEEIEISKSDRSQKEAVGLSQVEIIHYIKILFDVVQDVCEDIHQKDAHMLMNVAQEITQGRASVIFHSQRTKVHMPSKIHNSYPIQFGKVVYGLLCVFVDPNRIDRPALPPYEAILLAQLYGWLLYTCEQTAIVQGQYHRLEYHIYGTLTKREHEVLTLMCRGFMQNQIAQKLHIAVATVIKHKQRIYSRSGVHNESDALIVAYHTGIVSLMHVMH